MPVKRELFLRLEGEKKLPKRITCNGMPVTNAKMDGSAVLIQCPATPAYQPTRIEVVF